MSEQPMSEQPMSEQPGSGHQRPMVASGIGDPTRYLVPGETAVIGVRRHFMVLVVSFLETLGFIAIALMLSYLFETVQWVHTISGLIVLFSALRFGYHIIEWRMERLVVTRQRMMLVGGVLTRRVGVIPMPKITDLTYEKPLMGQIFGYGTFIVESAGQDQAMSRIEYLPRADSLYRTISTLLFRELAVGGVGSSDNAAYETGRDDEFDESGLVEVPHEIELHHADGNTGYEPFTSYDDPAEYPTGPIQLDLADRVSDDDGTGAASTGASTSIHARSRSALAPRSRARRRSGSETQDDQPVGKLSDAFSESRPPRWARRR